MKSAEADEPIMLAATTLYHALIDAELTWVVIGAGRGNTDPDRTAHRSRYRPRLLSTRSGNSEAVGLEATVGLFFPSLLERGRGRRVDQALFAVVVEGLTLYRFVATLTYLLTNRVTHTRFSTNTSRTSSSPPSPPQTGSGLSSSAQHSVSSSRHLPR